MKMSFNVISKFFFLFIEFLGFGGFWGFGIRGLEGWRVGGLESSGLGGGYV